MPTTGYWETAGCVTLNGSNSGSSASLYSSSTDGTGTIYVSTSNACGGNYYKTAVMVITGQGGDCGELPESIEDPVLEISPNPAVSYIDIEIRSQRGVTGMRTQIMIVDSNSKIVRQATTESSRTRVDLSGLVAGTYVVIADTGTERLYGKFMLLR